MPLLVCSFVEVEDLNLVLLGLAVPSEVCVLCTHTRPRNQICDHFFSLWPGEDTQSLLVGQSV